MSSKTIRLRKEAYERLRAARRYPGESFSAVVLRATWPETTTTGKAFLDICRERGAVFDAAALDRVEALKRDDFLRGGAVNKLSREDTYRAMAAEREDWSDLDATLADGLE